MVDPESNPPARPLASQRSRVLVGLAAILLALRAALPLVLAPIVAERADQALEGHIAFDDLDLALLRGGVTLHGLSIYTEEAPASGPPLFEADRLATEISWLALASHTLEIEAFEVEDFVLRLDRFAEGIRLPRLAAASDPAADPDEESRALDWSVAADGVSLVGGRLEIVDHTVEGEAQLVAFEIEDLSARELAVRSVHADDEPGRISIDAKLDEGSVSLATWIKRYEAGFDVRTTIVLDDLPIDDLRAYLTPLGWSALGNLCKTRSLC
jgi:uncharacterized protein involved in outer membrane biogenesis